MSCGYFLVVLPVGGQVLGTFCLVKHRIQKIKKKGWCFWKFLHAICIFWPVCKPQEMHISLVLVHKPTTCRNSAKNTHMIYLPLFLVILHIVKCKYMDHATWNMAKHEDWHGSDFTIMNEMHVRLLMYHNSTRGRHPYSSSICILK